MVKLNAEGSAVVRMAAEEARGLGHTWLGCEHLLLGLLAHEEGLAAGVLGGQGVSLPSAREQVEAQIGDEEGGDAAGAGAPHGGSAALRWTPRLHRVLAQAEVEAERLGATRAGSGHLLLALTRHESVASSALSDLGVDASALVDGVLAALGVPREAAERYRRERQAAEEEVDRGEDALRAAYAHALASPAQREERVSALLAGGGPVVIDDAAGIERLRERAAQAGFAVLDASGGSDSCWVLANLELRQLVLLIADRDDKGRVSLGISGRAGTAVPGWCHQAIARLAAQPA